MWLPHRLSLHLSSQGKYYTTGEEIKVRGRKPTAFQSNQKAVKLKKQCFATFLSVLPETKFQFGFWPISIQSTR
jgi:hypothetical protein